MKLRRWTKGEVQNLEKWYGAIDLEEISKRLSRSKSAIRTKASDLKIVAGRNEWSQNEVDFLRENYLELGARAVAEELGRSIAAVHTRIRMVGGGRPSIGPKVEWDEKSLRYLRDNYQTQTYEEIGEAINRTPMAVQTRGSILGLKRYVDPFPFFETWTEESAYVVGFWAADGWASKRGPESIRIGFVQKDPDIIYKIAEVVGGSTNVVLKGSGMYQCYFHSVKTYEWLCEIFGHDVCQKSHTLQWPKIPDKYIRHFLRGAYDGDGSLMWRKDNLWETSYTTSSKEFIYALAENIYRLTGITIGVGLNKMDAYHARCVGIKAICLIDWLYRDNNIALERKEQRAIRAMETSGGFWDYSVTPKMREMFPHIISRYEAT